MEQEMNSDSLGESRRQARNERRRMQWERHVQRHTQRCTNMRHTHKEWIGVAIILVGVVWLLNVLGVSMPNWMFTWEMLLVVIGLFTGLASRFRNFFSIILILIGLVFLGHDFFWPNTDVEKFLWPALIIFVGFMFIIKRRYWESRKQSFIENRQQFIKDHPEWESMHDRWHHGGWDYWKDRWEEKHSSQGQGTPPPSPSDPIPAQEGIKGETASEEKDAYQKKTSSFNDWLDCTTVFGGTKRQVISKSFKGGDLINVCGGTELDLTRADIQGTAVIDIVNLWGGIRIAVPPNWQIRTNLTHIMAGVDDNKRTQNQVQDPDKVLILTGVVLMSGIEIRDFL